MAGVVDAQTKLDFDVVPVGVVREVDGVGIGLGGGFDRAGVKDVGLVGLELHHLDELVARGLGIVEEAHRHTHMRVFPRDAFRLEHHHICSQRAVTVHCAIRERAGGRGARLVRTGRRGGWGRGLANEGKEGGGGGGGKRPDARQLPVRSHVVVTYLKAPGS